MTNAEHRACTPAQLEDWLLASGWRRHNFMGWVFEKNGRNIHCNRTGAIEMQLRRDAQRKRKTTP